MSVENFFALKALPFCLCFTFCSWFCMLFQALFERVLWCGSAWFVVRFGVAYGDL